MRTSVLSNDPGYVNFRHGQQVYLDGKNITKHCQTADEELGEVRVLKCNEDGEHYYCPGTDDVPWKILKGDVKIVLDN